MYDLFDGHMDHHVSIRIEISRDRRNDGQHVFIKHAEKSAGHIRAVSRHGGIKIIDGGADMGGWGSLRNNAAFLVDDPGLCL